jgi:hypothetical protein
MVMLGAKCSPCCQSPCADCPEGVLPETLTVHITGKPGDPQQGANLLSLSFSKTCFGSGAAGTVQGTGEDVGAGPLTGVTLTSGGNGYAKLGRQSPTLSLANTNTTPADVSISLTQSQDACNLDLWSVDSISVTDGGEGYTDGESLVLTKASGDTVVTAATGTINTVGRVQPTITASTASGSGATFTVAIVDNKTDPASWSITGVTFTGTTSGFVDGEAVTFSGTNLVALATAAATVVTNRVLPQLSASLPFPAQGNGATLSVTLASNSNNPETWSVSSVSIGGPGTSYSIGDVVQIAVVSGSEVTPAYIEVDQVDVNGEILSLSIIDGGEYYDNGDELDSISVSSGGEYYRDDGEIASVTITDGGAYYNEDASLTPYVETPTITVQQLPPSNGTGAQVTATVDDDTSSATFGQVVSLSLDNAGDDYLAWEWVYLCDCTNTEYTVVVRRMRQPLFGEEPEQPQWVDFCRYIGFRCADTIDPVWPDTRRDSIQVIYSPPPQKPVVLIQKDTRGEDDCFAWNPQNCVACGTVLTSTTEESDCDSLEFTAESESESVTAEVTVGGEWDDDLYLSGLCEFLVRLENLEFNDPEFDSSAEAAQFKTNFNGDYYLRRTTGANTAYSLFGTPPGECQYLFFETVADLAYALIITLDETGAFLEIQRPGFSVTRVAALVERPESVNSLLSCQSISGSAQLSPLFSPAGTFDYTIECP